MTPEKQEKDKKVQILSKGKAKVVGINGSLAKIQPLDPAGNPEGPELFFDQAFSRFLNIEETSEVFYQTVDLPNGEIKAVAILPTRFDLHLETAEISEIDASNCTGLLKLADNSTIPFCQNYLAESLYIVTSSVKFYRLLINGCPMGVCLTDM